jgi:hypothetical protein
MTNNKQQTAVEWFWNQLPEILPFTVDTETAVKLQEAYQQAKEMDKIQKFYMFNCGRQYQLTGEGTFKQVYNETYGGGEQ